MRIHAVWCLMNKRCNSTICEGSLDIGVPIQPVADDCYEQVTRLHGPAVNNNA
jgi:hypothetical protein